MIVYFTEDGGFDWIIVLMVIPRFIILFVVDDTFGLFTNFYLFIDLSSIFLHQFDLLGIQFNDVR